MTRYNAYKFCPQCGHKLIRQSKTLLRCNSGHAYYISPKPSNVIILENDRGEILLTKRGIAPRIGYYDFPGGFINSGEALEESAKREIKEELGIDIEIVGYLGSYPGMYLYKNINYETIAFALVAKITKGKILINDDVSGYIFMKKNKVSNTRLAFPYFTKIWKDYLSQYQEVREV